MDDLVYLQGNEAIRYLEFCVQVLGIKDQAIHNYLLALYAKIQPEQLLKYLDLQGTVCIITNTYNNTWTYRAQYVLYTNTYGNTWTYRAQYVLYTNTYSNTWTYRAQYVHVAIPGPTGHSDIMYYS